MKRNSKGNKNVRNVAVRVLLKQCRENKKPGPWLSTFSKAILRNEQLGPL